MPKGGHYFDDTSFNRGDRIDPQKFRPIADIPDEQLKLLADYGRSLYHNTDYAILGWGFGVCFSWPEPHHRPLQQRHAGAD